jgi:hypothetical protein
MLLAMLKKTHADLELFALGAKTPDEKDMYSQNAKQLCQIIEQLKPFLP